MLIKTEQGTVVAKRGSHLTFLLISGNRITATVKRTSLKLGSCCNLVIDSSTCKITRIFQEECSLSKVAVETPDDSEIPTNAGELMEKVHFDEVEGSRLPRDEDVDWEREEFIVECSRDTEE